MRDTRGTAAVEAAIFLPIFVVLMFGISDLGAAMFKRMQVNAAAQAGAAHTIIKKDTTAFESAMNDAAGDPFFCTNATCSATIAPCADGEPKCVTVSASYSSLPILPSDLYAWAQSMDVSYTVTARIQ